VPARPVQQRVDDQARPLSAMRSSAWRDSQFWSSTFGSTVTGSFYQFSQALKSAYL
jgi:hypothetical protein